MSVPLRGTWSNEIESIFSLIGYAVGFGNLWRFPYVCYRNGGAAFLIPYVFFTLVVGIPLFYLECYIGQFTSSTPLKAWAICPLLSGIGWTMTLMSFMAATYFAMIVGWTLYYLVASMSINGLPWMSCDNYWNTQNCVDGSSTPNFTDNSDYNQYSYNQMSFMQSASSEYWERRVLSLSSGLDDIDLRWELLLCLAAAWIIMFVCIIKGAQSIGKVVYVTATLPYLLLFVLCLRFLILPGSFTGIQYYLMPDLERLLDFRVWADALVQSFYSLGFGFGGITTLASFNKFKQNCFRDSLIVPVINAAVSFCAGIVMFSAVGYLAMTKGISINDVITSGPGLIFVVLPEVFGMIPAGQFFSFIFFLAVFLIGIDTLFGSIETYTFAIMDLIPKLGRWQIPITAATCFVSFLCGVIYSTSAGIYYFILIEWTFYFTPILIALLELLVVSWIYGLTQFPRDIKMMTGINFAIIDVATMIMLGIVTPLIMLLLFIFSCAQIYEPMYKSYVFPSWALGIGWLIVVAQIVPIFVLFIFNFIASLIKKKAIFAAFFNALRPGENWGPANEQDRTNYKYQGFITCGLTSNSATHQGTVLQTYRKIDEPAAKV